jgi:hypothetical protein
MIAKSVSHVFVCHGHDGRVKFVAACHVRSVSPFFWAAIVVAKSVGPSHDVFSLRGCRTRSVRLRTMADNMLMLL